jgi:hypothetical protein
MAMRWQAHPRRCGMGGLACCTPGTARHTGCCQARRRQKGANPQQALLGGAGRIATPPLEAGWPQGIWEGTTLRVAGAASRSRAGRRLFPLPTAQVSCYSSQNSRMASCSACTLGNPRAEAAASRPPNCWTSAETLWP